MADIWFWKRPERDLQDKARRTLKTEQYLDFLQRQIFKEREANEKRFKV
jgi:hypothetical protein